MDNRNFFYTEVVVLERLKYIADFIDNLQEVLLEGLSPDMDSISSYILSKHCDELSPQDDSTSLMIPPKVSSETGVSQSLRGSGQRVSNSAVFFIRSSAEHAVDRSTNRGRSCSVTDGHMSNVVIPGVDIEHMYRKVIRRQVELELYSPSVDAVSTMLSRQFGAADIKLKR